MSSTKRRVDIRGRSDEICVWYRELTSYEIADRLGISRCLVTKILKENGVILRPCHKRKGIEPWNKGKEHLAIRGDKNPRWRGGITNLNQQIRHCIEYKNWIRAVFERDKWKCVLCDKIGGNIEADHFPKKFCDIIRENKITSYEEAKQCSELWNPKNGRTVCLRCHNRTKQVRSRFKKVGATKMQDSFGRCLQSGVHW